MCIRDREEGDSLYFAADVPHRFDNAGEGECSYYLVIDSRGAQAAGASGRSP